MNNLEQMLKVVRIPYPISTRSEIFSEFPKELPYKVDHYSDCLELNIFDPRKVMAEPWNKFPNKVQIRLVNKKYPMPTPSCLHIVETRLIAIVKEYSFEEWDS